MRTTISLDEALLRQVRSLAAAGGRTLSDFVEEALRLAIARRDSPRPPTELTTFSGDGLMPGVDLDDTAALLDVMDEGDGDAAL